MSDNFDARKLFDLYIHDYMLRKDIPQVADMFAKEANFKPELMASDSEEGFLREWWYIFWDHFCSWQQGVTDHQTGEPSDIQATGEIEDEFGPTPPQFQPAPPQTPSPLNTSNEEFSSMHLETIFQDSSPMSIFNPHNTSVDVMQMPDLPTPNNMPVTMRTPNFSAGITRDKQTIRMMPTPKLPTGTTVDSQAIRLMPSTSNLPTTTVVNPRHWQTMSVSMTDTNTYTNTHAHARVAPSFAQLEEVYGPMSPLLKLTLGQEMARRVVRASAPNPNPNPNPNLNDNAASSSRENSRMQSSSRTNLVAPFASRAPRPSPRRPK